MENTLKDIIKSLDLNIENLKLPDIKNKLKTISKHVYEFNKLKKDEIFNLIYNLKNYNENDDYALHQW